MNQKIESTETAQSSSEFSPDFIRILIALTGATLLLVFAVEHQMFSDHGRPFVRMYLYPWVVAGGTTISNGLDEFSGISPAPLGTSVQLAGLLGLLFGFVIGPTLFFFGWENRRKDRASGATVPMFKGASVISIIGGLLTFAVAVPSVPIAILQTQAAARLQAAQAVQDNKDRMINDLVRIAYNARQFRILPKSFDGGQGSFVGYAMSQALAATDEGSYEAEITPNRITMKAQSKKYPDCRIAVYIDTSGQFNGWGYEGAFD